MTWFIRAQMALDDHWLSDLLATACSFANLWIGFLAGAVLP